MDHKSIKKMLKDGYEQLGFDVISESENGDTLLRYPEPGAVDVTLRLTNEDVIEFAQFYQARRQFRAAPAQVSMMGTNFREHLLVPLANGIHPEDIESVLPAVSANDTYVEIGIASPVYCNFMRFDPGYGKLCIDRLFTLPQRAREATIKQPLDIRAIFARPLTIRVFQIRAGSLQEAQHISDGWIDRTLFTLAYEYRMPVTLAQNWLSSRIDRLNLIRNKDHQTGELFAPDVRFRSDLVRLYQAGIAADIPAHQFLAWFQILELFFQEVDHAGVYAGLQQILSEPDFAPEPASLARIVQTVEASRKDNNAQQRLAQLIRQHSSAGEAEITAQRLLAIHEAIISAGTIPASMESISRELPQLKQLAEAVIVATQQG